MIFNIAMSLILIGFPFHMWSYVRVSQASKHRYRTPSPMLTKIMEQTITAAVSAVLSENPTYQL